MDKTIGNNGEVQFANGQSSRDLRPGSENLHERTDSSNPLEALRRGSDEVIERRIRNERRQPTRTVTMDNEINQLLLLGIFCVVAIVIADWALRPRDRDQDD